MTRDTLSIPPFRPHPLLRGAHAQTVAGAFWAGSRHPDRATQHLVQLEDGDRIVLHENCPAGWCEGEQVALLIHGLGGCHASRYMQRTAGRLQGRGVRVFRMDLRGCGAGLQLARRPFHAGRSEDVAAALRYLAVCCGSSPVAVVAFSLGANVALKMAGEYGQHPPANFRSLFAVSPPIDLMACAGQIRSGIQRLYDRRFVRWLNRYTHVRRRHIPGLAKLPQYPRPRTLWEFDEKVTAPLSGFHGAADYYRRCSAAAMMPAIRVATFILASADDPLVPARIFQDAQPSASTLLHVSPQGGHLGFLAAAGGDPDRRWMDWRIVDWVVANSGR